MTREDTAQESEALSAYEAFQKKADANQYNAALRILAAQPSLIDYMRVTEIPSHYALIRHRVGDAEADQFLRIVHKSLDSMAAAIEGGTAFTTALRKARPL